MLLFKREKKVVELILKHLDMVDDCLKTSLETVEFYLQGDISQAKVHARSARSIESEADRVRFDIRNHLIFCIRIFWGFQIIVNPGFDG